MRTADLLSEAVAELYTADPDGFTERRGALVAQARAAGDAAAARSIARLRKPTRSAWAINQLVRADPSVPARLAGLGDQLRAAERSMDGTRIRELSLERRQLIATLVHQALAISGPQQPPAALREELTSTFSAALADREFAGQLAAGILLRAERRTGFGSGAAALMLVRAPERSEPAHAATTPAQTGTTTATATAGAAPTDATTAPATTPLTRARRGSGTAVDALEKALAKEQEREEARARAAEARATAERERREALADAEQVVADAGQATEAAALAEREQENAVRLLEDQLDEARLRLSELRLRARRARNADRKAREALDQLRK